MTITPAANRTWRRLLAPALLAALIWTAPAAQALQVTGGFTGWWSQPDQQNHGVIVAISRLPSGEKTGVLYWAHFDLKGNPAWLFAQGEIQGDTISAQVFEFGGITFMQSREPGARFGEMVGTMEVTFSDCLNGTVVYDTAVVGSGEFGISRLTNQPGAVCSGGISDDVRPHDLPQTFTARLRLTEGFAGARGEMMLDLRPGRAEFAVRVEGLAEGRYSLHVGGEPRGEFDVAPGATTPEGEIRFRSPRIPGRMLLDFDPRGQSVEILDANGVVVLSGQAPEHGRFMGGHGEPPFALPESGSSMVELEFDSAGVYPDGTAVVRMEAAGDSGSTGDMPGDVPRGMTLSIEVRAIPAGSYQVLMGNRELGVIEVADDEAGTIGSLQFGFPPLAGQMPFNFDPSGAMFAIFQDATLLFSVEFPEQVAGTGIGRGPGMGGPGMGGPGMGGPGMGGGPSLHSEVSIALDPQRDEIAGSAEARFVSTPMRLELSVQLAGVPSGDYRLNVGGLERAIIPVDATGRGWIRFRDSVGFGDLPLDFAVLGQPIEIADNAGVVFTGEMPE